MGKAFIMIDGYKISVESCERCPVHQEADGIDSCWHPNNMKGGMPKGMPERCPLREEVVKPPVVKKAKLPRTADGGNTETPVPAETNSPPQGSGGTQSANFTQSSHGSSPGNVVDGGNWNINSYGTIPTASAYTYSAANSGILSVPIQTAIAEKRNAATWRIIHTVLGDAQEQAQTEEDDDGGD